MKILTGLFFIAALCSCSPQPAEDGPVSQRELNLMHLAQTMQTGGDIPAAVDLYLRAAGKSKHRIDAHLALAKLYEDINQPEKVREALLAAKKRQPENPRVNLALGKEAIAQGNAQEAIAYFDTGLTQDEMNVDLLNGKGVALDMLQQHEEAQVVYRQALYVQATDNDFLQSNLAMSSIMNGDYGAAITQLENVSTLQDSAIIRQNLALAYGLNGNMTKAKKLAGESLTVEQLKEDIAYYKDYTAELKDQKRAAE